MDMGWSSNAVESQIFQSKVLDETTASDEFGLSEVNASGSITISSGRSEVGLAASADQTVDEEVEELAER